MTYEPKNLILWHYPECYAGASWDNYYAFLSRSRDSSLLDESNFECALERLGGENNPMVVVIRERHWAYGWLEWIAIHKDDEKALRLADEMCGELERYPALNEDDWSERQYEAAYKVWEEMFSSAERLDFLRQWVDTRCRFRSFAELLQCVRIGGYAPTNEICEVWEIN